MDWPEIVCHILVPGLLGTLAGGAGITRIPWTLSPETLTTVADHQRL
ncbi:hypothetical protein [Streptomyces umbrinus]